MKRRGNHLYVNIIIKIQLKQYTRFNVIGQVHVGVIVIGQL